MWHIRYPVKQRVISQKQETEDIYTDKQESVNSIKISKACKKNKTDKKNLKKNVTWKQSSLALVEISKKQQPPLPEI